MWKGVKWCGHAQHDTKKTAKTQPEKLACCVLVQLFCPVQCQLQSKGPFKNQSGSGALQTCARKCFCVYAHLLRVFADCVLCLCVLFCLFWRLCLQWRRWLPRGVFTYGRWCPLGRTFWLDSHVLRAVRCQTLQCSRIFLYWSVCTAFHAAPVQRKASRRFSCAFTCPLRGLASSHLPMPFQTMSFKVFPCPMVDWLVCV